MNFDATTAVHLGVAVNLPYGVRSGDFCGLYTSPRSFTKPIQSSPEEDLSPGSFLETLPISVMYRADKNMNIQFQPWV